MSSVRFNKLFALISVIVAFTFVTGLLPAYAETEPQSMDVDEMRSQISELEARAQELSDSISALKDDESRKEELKTSLETQITNTQSQIDLVSNEVMALNKSIDELTLEIADKEKQLEETKELFKKRLRAMYMTGNISELILMMGSDDMGDYLSKSELTRSVSKRDNALMQEIVDTIEGIRAAEAEIENDRSAKSAAQIALSQKQVELETQVSAVNGLLSELGAQSMSLTAEQEATLAAMDEYENQIESALEAARLEEERRQEEERREQEANNSSGGSSEGGTSSGSSDPSDDPDDGKINFLWPVPGFYYITSPYGWRTHPITGTQRFHSGADIADWGIDGEPILAAEDGRVSLASYNAGGYGNYVMIYHGTKDDGNEYATLYAHMKRYIVSEGQQVKKGDVIGYVGTTGASTGSHLHFEVRINGETTNPLAFF